MDLGTAIQAIRKKKRISAKDLAAKCGISANALCCIERNYSFPAKETMKKICKALNIPPAYLLFFSITDEDLPEKSRALFNILESPLREALLQDISNQN